MSDRLPTRSRRSAGRHAVQNSVQVSASLLLGFLLLGPGVLAQEPALAEMDVCPEATSEGTILYGQVYERTSRLVLPGSEIRLAWKQARGVADTVRGQLEAVSDDRGIYRFCEVPSDALLNVWASALGKTGPPATLFVGQGEQLRQDLELRLTAPVRGALVGTLADTQTGETLEAAQVWIENLGVGIVADAGGRFELREVPAGPQELTIRHIGYGEQSVTVEVVPNRTRHIKISLAPKPVELTPITVTVDMRPVWLERVGFYDRKAKSLGQFMGPAWMERRRPYRFSQVFENVHGVRISPVCRPHCYYLLRSTTQGSSCPFTFYIDGKRLRLGSIVDLDALVPASDVAAVEVYRGISQTPARYYGRCGSVVIWTKRG